MRKFFILAALAAVFAVPAARADDAPVPCSVLTVCTHDRVPPPQFHHGH
jgi:FlaG/FlaF family flagellin (archaellin)